MIGLSAEYVDLRGTLQVTEDRSVYQMLSCEFEHFFGNLNVA